MCVGLAVSFYFLATLSCQLKLQMNSEGVDCKSLCLLWHHLFLIQVERTSSAESSNSSKSDSAEVGNNDQWIPLWIGNLWTYVCAEQLKFILHSGECRRDQLRTVRREKKEEQNRRQIVEKQNRSQKVKEQSRSQKVDRQNLPTRSVLVKTELIIKTGARIRQSMAKY